MNEPLLEVKDINVEYRLREKVVKAVRGINLRINKKEIVGIVGESGCGKSTLAMTFLKLVDSPGKITSGQIIYHGKTDIDVLKLKPSGLRKYRWKEVSMIFQGSMNALNPVTRIEEQIMDTMLEHGYDQETALKRVDELLRVAGLNPSVKNSFPHELSGGMKQRVNIAISLACEPSLVIADEATTALDVVVQRQIMARLLKLRDELGISLVFITHDISLVANIADRVYVMYAGKVVENAPVEELFYNPKHPYTIALLNSIPSIQKDKKIKGIPGTPPDLSKPIKGCPFAPRCNKAFDKCHEVEPDLISIGQDHEVSCHLYG
ncbi:MAG: ABC transporter ATP-binding protein [Thermoplasmatales archaeon]|jgi:peptide/nickel transport system ATP-binding protein